jgi:hypothetical protein
MNPDPMGGAFVGKCVRSIGTHDELPSGNKGHAVWRLWRSITTNRNKPHDEEKRQMELHSGKGNGKENPKADRRF